MVQLLAAESIAVQLLVCVNCELSDEIEVMFKSALPELVRVIVCAALVVPTACEAKVSDVGDGLATAPIPVPVSETVCGEFPALSVMVTVPVREFAPSGVKVTVRVQLPFTIRLLPQLWVTAKSPEAKIVAIDS